MILNAIAEGLKRRSKDDFKGRHFNATLIVQAVSWYLRYPLSYRRGHAVAAQGFRVRRRVDDARAESAARLLPWASVAIKA